jgi:Tol biopolymer transport system component
VYLAQDVRHDRKVAIKVLHPELSAVIGAERFLAEIKTTAALQHPHILPLFDSGTADGLLFYVMPFVDGETLRARLAREKQLPIADAVRVTREVANALDYAHRRGIIHRDIKPENILLHEGQALVADFGIALAVQSAGGQRMTQTGLSLGTPQYMSPEQAMGEREIGARSDVYSLGAVAYEMLVGEPPFVGPTTQAVFAKVMTEDARPLIPQRRSVPPEVEGAVLRALEKLPADRFGSAAEFGAALERPLPAAAGRARAAHPSTRPAWQSYAPWALGVIAALVIGYVAGRGTVGDDGSDVAYAQKTFADYAIYNARFSPDGQTIVYSGTPEGLVPELFVVRPDYPEPQPLGLEESHLLSISSRGELAVLVRAKLVAHRLMLGTLARMPLGGGAPRELVDGVREATWSPDGSELAVIRQVGANDRLEYPVGKVLVEVPGYLSDPTFSRDGKHIAFAEHPLRYDNRGAIAVVDLSGKKTVLTPKEFSGIEGTAWSASGDEIFFSARDVSHQMVVQAVSLDGDLRVALNGAGDLTVQDVASNGQLLLTRESQLQTVFVRGPGQAEARDVGWLDYTFHPALSPDGSMIAFGDASAAAGINYSVLLRKTDGGRAARLGEGWPAEFSRDGKWLLSVVPTTPAKIMIYPSGAGTERVVPSGSLEGISHAAWGPGEQSVIACGNEKDKPPACYIVDLEGGPPRAAPFEGWGLASPDGTMFVAQKLGGPAALHAVAGGVARPVPGFEDGDIALRWSPDSRALWVRQTGSFRVERLDIATGGRTLLIDIPMPSGSAIRSVGTLRLADDPSVYAYQLATKTSQLFTVEGVR